ncbi:MULTISPECIES: AraC family transcriptional regulator [Cronobacter]|uniref:AraC family transcriptional regulator n=1 Tax=Cronobacter TaxID=413496 RepID=UPI0024C2F24D|nr:MULTISPECIES: AraC family transcriptional regulator [Cronobacter]MDK1184622.1 AraC family transcriptional regulator [Cronobacter turicensis]MDK1191328.1 AraC family transcriptional regulator [Cronobacter dublinensis]MDK1201967.1 AraC family transcriptional regulator [Cronobacter dublinensis]MDK1208256.1 AraC family transcriptional regulator [Cronobacter turicensis]MDK1216741.1 AraC family transcriptional regulator [Cronobacter turicensis]
MNTLRALSSLTTFHLVKSQEQNNSLILKRIRFYNCAIIYLRNAQLLIKSTNGQTFIIPPQSLCYIEKNTVIDVSLRVLGKEGGYEIYHIDSDILSCICHAMEPLLLKPQKVNQIRQKIFIINAEEIDIKIFKRLTSSVIPKHRHIYKITYLLSKVNDIESLAHSLSVSTEITFTEKLKKIIESELSRPWKLVDLASILHMSEVCVRKKLEKEGNNFNELLREIRMHRAARLITTTDMHINCIANEVGYTSTSYFIRNFKGFFGITPKQFSLKIKK